MEELEGLVSEEAEQSDYHDADEDPIGEKAAHRGQDHVAEPLFDATSSATTRYVHAQPIVIRRVSMTPGIAAGTKTLQTMLRRLAPKVYETSKKISRDVARNVGDQDDLLEECADEHDSNLLFRANTDPEDKKWDERADG